MKKLNVRKFVLMLADISIIFLSGITLNYIAIAISLELKGDFAQNFGYVVFAHALKIGQAQK